MVLGWIDHAVHKSFHVAAQGGQWRAQFVGYIADQLGAALFGRLESGGHGVEALPELA